MMRILITGGAGYLGTVTALHALSRGHEVAVVDRMWFEQPSVSEALRQAVVLKMDAADLPSSAVEQADWVFHMAALSNDGTCDMDPEEARRTNVSLTEHIGLLCASAQKPMIFASSASVYGKRDEGLCAETSPTLPQSLYATTKLEAEGVLQHLCKTRGLRCIVLRQGTLFGVSPRMRYDLVVNRFVAAAVTASCLVVHGLGAAWRPLLAVEDAARVWVGLAERTSNEWWAAQADCPVFNVAQHEGPATKAYRISELAVRLLLALQDRGVQARIEWQPAHTRDTRSYAVDARLIRAAGFVCPTSPTDALPDLVRMARQHGDACDDPLFNNVPMMQRLGLAGGRVNT